MLFSLRMLLLRLLTVFSWARGGGGSLWSALGAVSGRCSSGTVLSLSLPTPLCCVGKMPPQPNSATTASSPRAGPAVAAFLWWQMGRWCLGNLCLLRAKRSSSFGLVKNPCICTVPAASQAAFVCILFAEAASVILSTA